MKTETLTLQKTVDAQAAKIVQEDAIIKQRDSRIFSLESRLEEKGINPNERIRSAELSSEIAHLQLDLEKAELLIAEKDAAIARLFAKLEAAADTQETVEEQRHQIDELAKQLQTAQHILNQQSSLGEVGNLLEHIGKREEQEESEPKHEPIESKLRVEAQILELKTEISRLQQQHAQHKRTDERQSEIIEQQHQRAEEQEAELLKLRKELSNQLNQQNLVKEEQQGSEETCAVLEEEIKRLSAELSESSQVCHENELVRQEMTKELQELEENRRIEVEQLINQINEEKESHSLHVEEVHETTARVQENNVQLSEDNAKLLQETLQQEQTIKEISAQFNELLNDNEVISASVMELEHSHLHSNNHLESLFDHHKEQVIVLQELLLEEELELSNIEQCYGNLKTELIEISREPLLEEVVFEHSRQLAEEWVVAHDDLEISQANSGALIEEIGEYSAALSRANKQIVDMFEEMRALRSEQTQLKTLEIESDERLKTSHLIKQELEMRLSTTM